MFVQGGATVCFSPDDQYVLIGGDDGARLWKIGDLEAAKVALDLPLPHFYFRHNERLFHASFSPDGRFVLTTSRDKTAKIWDLATGQPISPPLQHGGTVAWAWFNRAGTEVQTYAFADEA